MYESVQKFTIRGSMEHDEELWETLLRIIQYLKQVQTKDMNFEEYAQYVRDRGIFIDFLMSLRGMSPSPKNESISSNN